MKSSNKNKIKKRYAIVAKFLALSLALFMMMFFVTGCSSPRLRDWGPVPNREIGEQFASFRIYMAGVDPRTGNTFNYLHRYDWRGARFYMTDTLEQYTFEDVTGRIRGRGNSTWNVSATTGPNAEQEALIVRPPTLGNSRINPHLRNHWNHERNPATPRMQKWPFRIRFDEPRSMLGTSSVSTDWSFIANHSDYTQLRNEAATILAHSLSGMEWQTRSRFVHVYWNGDYRGVYWMAEQLEVSNYGFTRQQDEVIGRVPLRYDPNPAYSDYFIELDLRADRLNTNIEARHHSDFRQSAEYQNLAPREGRDFLRVGGRNYDIRFPDDTREVGVGRSGESFTARANTPAHVAYLRRFITEVDNAINSHNWRRINQWIDVNSFVDYFIVHEFFNNMDSGGLSVHKTIQGIGDERRMHMGPIWDFDLSAGNTHPSTSWGTYNSFMRRGGYGYKGVWSGYINRWFRNLLNVPQFFERVGYRFAMIRDNQIQDMMDEVLEFAVEHELEFERNFRRWSEMHGRRTWTQSPEIVALGSGTGAFMRNVEHLIGWFEGRRDWMTQWLTYGSGTNTAPLTFN